MEKPERRAAWRRRTLACAVACALLLAAVQPAAAQVQVPSTEDVVTLRDGTILRGHVTLLKPNDHLEIVLLDGRTQSVQWSLIAASVGPSFPAPKTRPAERFLKPAPGRARVIVESTGRSLTVGVLSMRPAIGQDSATISDGVSIDQFTADYQSRKGVVVCVATPCQIFARPGPLTLQTSGLGLLASSSEVIVPPEGVRVRVRAPQASDRRAAVLFGAWSLATVLTGGIVAATGAGFTDPIFGSTGRDMYIAGGAVAAIGIGLGVAALVYWRRGRTGIESVEPAE